MEKVCPKCKIEKKFMEFHKHKHRKYGLSYECKVCANNRFKVKREKDKIKRTEKDKIKRTEKDKELIEKYVGLEFGSYKVTKYLGRYTVHVEKYERYYFEKECRYCGYKSKPNINQLNSAIKRHIKCNYCKESFNIHTRQKKCSHCNTWLDATSKNFFPSKTRSLGVHYYCKDCHNKKSRKRRESKEVREKEYLQKKERLKTDKLYKLTSNIKCLIRNSIKGKGFTKKTKTYKILGCTYKEFKTHIESQWEEWMCWDNHGSYNGKEKDGWDFDHIIPLSSVNTEKEIIKLNHYTNFQPLCSHINRYVKRDLLGWDNKIL